jgi:small subunit ribosomal protein S13
LARISGVDLPREKRIEIALTYITGIGLTSSQKILAKTGVSGIKRVTEITSEEIAAIRDEITENYKVEGALRSETQMNIKRLMDIGCYRGLRHRRNMPCHGQRTHTNARTRRGKRSTAVAKKK